MCHRFLEKESLMRRSIASGVIILTFSVLTACGSPAQETQGKTQRDVPKGAGKNPSHLAVPTPSTDAGLVKNARPCSVVTAEMVNRAMATDYPGSSFRVLSVDGVDVNNPPTTGSFTERNCAYTGVVAGTFGDNSNNSPHTLTVMVTTFVDDKQGSVWKGMDMASSSDRHVVGIGEDAIVTDVEMVAREGQIIAKVWSHDDTEGVLTDSIMAAILTPAMANLAG